MRYPDTIKLATTTSDGYGDRTITVLSTVNALFVHRSQIGHNQFADDHATAAVVYLDPKNAVVLAKLKELEGLYIENEDEWYRISHVSLGVRKLLRNDLDNVFCQLEKEPGLPYANTNVS